MNFLTLGVSIFEITRVQCRNHQKLKINSRVRVFVSEEFQLIGRAGLVTAHPSLSEHTISEKYDFDMDP